MGLKKKLLFGLAKGTVKGISSCAIGLGKFSYGIGKALKNKDAGMAAEIVVERTKKIALGSIAIGKETVYLGSNVGESIISGKSILNDKTIGSLTKIGSVVLTGIVVGEILADIGCDDVDAGEVIHTSVGLLPEIDISEMNEVQNGVLVDSSGLDEIIHAGEVSGTTHISTEDYIRDLSARDDFLHFHGFDRLPEGYEVHHIIPLCEGGADVPDNMILLSKEDHDIVTEAQAKYYRWS